MARIRNVKPELFQHGELYDLEAASGLPVRLAFIGLFCQADVDGRFRWRPRELKLAVLPFDAVDFDAVLEALLEAGFLERYEVAGRTFGRIPTFAQHQAFAKRERDRGPLYPGPDDALEAEAVPDTARDGSGPVPDQDRTRTGTGEEGRGKKDGGRPARPGVVRTWSRLWELEHGTGYVPGPFCIRSGLRLADALGADQAEDLEAGMGRFIRAEKTRGQSLDEFAKVASGLVASARSRRLSAEKPVRDEKAEDLEASAIAPELEADFRRRLLAIGRAEP